MKPKHTTFKHLTLEDRCTILSGINQGDTYRSMAKAIGKDPSTVAKEIRLHRTLVSRCQLPLACAAYRRCQRGRTCSLSCSDYRPFTCTRRDHSPGACNGCSNWSHCHFDKFRYIPERADANYHNTLKDSRSGVNLTSSEAQRLVDIIQPLIHQGQSIYHIVTHHPELGVCEKTLYNYIEGGVFSAMSDLAAISLRRQVSRKLPKRRAVLYKKRQDHRYLQGRLFSDYQAFCQAHPDVFVMQMDTVYNDVVNGPFIQTFKFLKSGLLFALLQPNRTTAAMVDGLNLLEVILGRSLFRTYAGILLTDRGSEFEAPVAMETAQDGSQRAHVFYCNSMAAGQKGSLENNHIELRYILPKATDLRALGLTCQAALNLALSHINSASVESLGGRCPLEVTHFLFPALYDRLSHFGLHLIPNDEVMLKPELLKAFR